MCFSAEASFIGAVVLGAIGCINLVKVSQRNQLLLAIMPFIFAAQQFDEGLLWLSTENIDHYLRYSSFLQKFFLFIAVLVWPVWIPLAFFVAETKKNHRLCLGLFLTGGVIYILYLIYGMKVWWSFNDVSLTVANHSLQYNLPEGNYFKYYILTLLPPLFSSLRGAWAFMILNLIGFFTALYFFEVALISVWCFFGAWVGIWTYALLALNKKEEKNSLMNS